MNLVDKISNVLTNKIMSDKIFKLSHESIDGISEDICELKRLKLELENKDIEINRRKVEWDRTFDSITDNIVIIDSDMKICKVNKSFVQCIKDEGIPWTELIGLDWDELQKNNMDMDLCMVSECFNTKQPQETIFDMKDFIYSVCVNPIFDNNRNVISVVRVSRDITKIETQKRKLDRRSRLFAAISQMSKTLTTHKKWDIALDDIFYQLGLAVGAHKVYIFCNTYRESRLGAKLEGVWTNPYSKCTSCCDIVDYIDYNSIPELKHNMKQGDYAQINILSNDLCVKKDQCSCSDNITVSVVPIFSNKEWWGFIGFDYYNGTKNFKDEDELILRIAADIIGGVIYRRKRYYEAVDKDINI